MSHENLSGFLNLKFFNLNYLIQEKYKVGGECDLQYNLLEEIEEYADDIHVEYCEYCDEEILDIVVACAEYCNMSNRFRLFTDYVQCRQYHMCLELVLREKVHEFFVDKEKVEMINKMITEYNECIFKLAINKLKRNKLVNEGFLLKVSIMKCGLF